MSAFTVSKKHIDLLVSFAAIKQRELHVFHKGETIYFNMHKSADACTQLGQILWTENQRSVNFRYKEKEAPLEYSETRMYELPSAVSILKLINCLEYQCCEPDDWTASLAFAILQRLKSIAIRSLPGYDEAPWGI